MPSIEWNKQNWDGDYDWSAAGDEWSSDWGGSEAHWHSTLHPRLRRLLPAGTVLEIAPGFGRWTQFLLPLCERYVGIELSTECVDACRMRFADAGHATFAVNDGRSLAPVEDGSVDLAFSFDSLVHVEADVMAGYLTELERKLTPDGVAVLHHSNLGEHARVFRRYYRLPRLVRGGLRRFGLIDRDHWRALSVSAAGVEAAATAAGLRVVGQETINWGSRRRIDCISMITRPGSRWDRENRVVENSDFMAEARSSRCSERVFGTGAVPSP
jgi:SAM-dependent methyltransferase